MSKESSMHDDADLFILARPLPKGTLVCYTDLKNNELSGRVKDAGMYMLWVEDLNNSDVTVFIRYKDLVAVLEQ
jgi:hypothetical protein